MIPGRADDHPNKPTLCWLEFLVIYLGSSAVGQQKVVGTNVRLCAICLITAWCMLAVCIAKHGGAPRFVQRHPILHFAAKACEEQPCILAKGGHDSLFWANPAFEISLQCGRQVPVVDGHPRLDAMLKTAVDHIHVKFDSLLIDRSFSIWYDSRPRDRQAVCLDTQISHELNVITETMIMIAGDVGVLAISNSSWLPDIIIPD
mmetsp:Transcript_149053/g.271273  ORF Transcript_149053/g.271273 Transcript_149053/m.271273 type:complete len:203 (+) Transcript_149053:476-1084(+)